MNTHERHQKESTASVSIRRAHLSDLPAIIALLADDPLGSQRELWEDPLPDGYRQAFAQIDTNSNQMLVVAELDGQVLGTFQMIFIRSLTYQGGLRGQIEAVRVQRDWRGKGIGGQMMRWAIEEARRRGCHLLMLTSDNSRKDAHRFYERLGFKASNVGMKLFLK
jgi:GNAT superfamily N-acetyltransferase